MRIKNIEMSEDRLAGYQKIIVDIVAKYLPNCRIYLFGSRARKTNLEGADIDIALDLGTLIERKVLTSIRDDIDESALPVFVDVVDVNSVSNEMKTEIKKDGILWKN